MAFLESIEHALLCAVPITTGWARSVYEYLNIGLADMYSTALAGRTLGGVLGMVGA
jgi:hypothetical protein